MAGVNVTPSTFALALLGRVGLPTGQDWQNIINEWVSSEGGFNAALAQRTNNPLNARCEYSEHQFSPWPVDGPNASCTSNGFVVWPTLDDAVDAYAAQLQIGAYTAIPKAQTPDALKAAIIASPWAAGHYGHGRNWSGGGGTVSSSGGSSSSSSAVNNDTNTILDIFGKSAGPIPSFFINLIAGQAGIGGRQPVDIATQAVESMVALLIGVVLVIKGFGTLTNTSAGDVAKLATAVGGLGAARAAAQTPAGMERVEARRSARTPFGHVSYTYRAQGRGGPSYREPGPVGPLTPVEDAIEEPQPAAPSASPETTREPVSRIETVRRGRRETEREALTREDMRTAFIRQMASINKGYVSRSKTRHDVEKDIGRKARRQMNTIRQETMERPSTVRGRRLE